MTKPESDAVPDLAPAVALSAGGVTFNVTFNQKTYAIQVFAPDLKGQYGFQVSDGGTVVAGLTYKDDTDWSIQVGLPAAFKIDNNLTINTLTVDLQAGAVQPLG